jgi:ABC-2 type transporter
MADGNIVY